MQSRFSARQFLTRANPQSELLNAERREFLQSIGAVRNNEVTGAGLLLFGTEATFRKLCPQHRVQYILQSPPVDVARNDFLADGLLAIVSTSRVDVDTIRALASNADLPQCQSQPEH